MKSVITNHIGSKKTRLFALFFGYVFVIALPMLRASVLTGPVTNSANQHIYYLLDTGAWSDSENEAISLGGHLVTINNQAEHDWVYGTFSSFEGISRHLWIGLYRTNVPGGFAWLNGEPFSFTRWASGEPNNCDQIEDRGMIFGPAYPLPGVWNDISDLGIGGCGGGLLTIYAVVEVDHSPPSILTQPVNRTVVAGHDANFSTIATSNQPLSYQWRFNGTNILDATAATLVLANVETNQAGLYSVEVSNLYGSIDSSNAVLTVNPVPPCLPLPPDMISWWRTEADAIDLTGTNNGTFQNGTTFADGLVNRAFQFDGIDDFVQIPNSPSLNVSSQLTVEFWMKADSGNTMKSIQGLVSTDFYTIGISKGQQSRYGVDFAISVNNGGFFNQISDQNGGGAVVTSNQWHHIAGTYNGTRSQLYIDGQPWGNPAVVAGTISPMLANSFLSIGSESGRSSCPNCVNGRFFKGLIDDVTIYNRALTPTEIAAIYSAGAGGKCTDPSGPVFLLQPTNRIVTLGSNAVLAAVAVGSGPLFYQWKFNGNPIANATNNTLTLSNIQPSKIGSYSVIVTNALDSVTSSNASVQVTSIFAFGNGKPLTNSTHTFGGAISIQLQTLFTNGLIFYTLDGSAPSFLSTQYSGTFTVSNTVTFRALAYSANFFESGEFGPVTLLVPPTYTLSASTPGGGSVALNPPGGSYLSNTTVTVTATPTAGWTFLQWLGDLAGSNNPATVSVTRNKRVQALFGTTFGATAAGNGSVTKSPESGFYPYGTVVTLVATPQAGSYFALWGNNGSGNLNPLYFTVTNANQSVSSLFVPLGVNQSALTVVPNGFGRVTISPQANAYAPSANVTLTAIPDADQTFLGWSGDATGSSNPLGLTMSTSKVITANFSGKPRLTLTPPLNGLFNDGFRFTLIGDFPHAYQIQLSTNSMDWLPLATLTNNYGQIQFMDATGLGAPARFYRALQLP